MMSNCSHAITRARKAKSLHKARSPLWGASRQRARCFSYTASMLRLFPSYFVSQSPKAGVSPRGGQPMQKGKGFGKKVFLFTRASSRNSSEQCTGSSAQHHHSRCQLPHGLKRSHSRYGRRAAARGMSQFSSSQCFFSWFFTHA